MVWPQQIFPCKATISFFFSSGMLMVTHWPYPPFFALHCYTLQALLPSWSPGRQYILLSQGLSKMHCQLPPLMPIVWTYFARILDQRLFFNHCRPFFDHFQPFWIIFWSLFDHFPTIVSQIFNRFWSFSTIDRYLPFSTIFRPFFEHFRPFFDQRVERDEVMRSGITRHHGVMPGDAVKYIVYLSQSTNRISRT